MNLPFRPRPKEGVKEVESSHGVVPDDAPDRAIILPVVLLFGSILVIGLAALGEQRLKNETLAATTTPETRPFVEDFLHCRHATTLHWKSPSASVCRARILEAAASVSNGSLAEAVDRDISEYLDKKP